MKNIEEKLYAFIFLKPNKKLKTAKEISTLFIKNINKKIIIEKNDGWKIRISCLEKDFSEVINSLRLLDMVEVIDFDLISFDKIDKKYTRKLSK